MAYSAAAAKSLQLCPTVFDHIDSSPPGSRQKYWSGLPLLFPLACFFRWLTLASYLLVHLLGNESKIFSLSVVLTVTPWTVAHQASL